jgi:hypothetical protein
MSNEETVTTTFGSAGTMLNGRYMAPPEDKDGKIGVRTSALVQGSPDDLYAEWHDIAPVPAVQRASSRKRIKPSQTTTTAG